MTSLSSREKCYLLFPSLASQGVLAVWDNFNPVSEIGFILGHPDDLKWDCCVQGLEDSLLG
jgi:hypothetical protein